MLLSKFKNISKFGQPLIETSILLARLRHSMYNICMMDIQHVPSLSDTNVKCHWTLKLKQKNQQPTKLCAGSFKFWASQFTSPHLI
jgi:hypothetical protein